MSIMNSDWTNIYKQYKGLWVALLSDGITVVGNGKTAEAARKNAEKNGHRETFLMSVPTEAFNFVG